MDNDKFKKAEELVRKIKEIKYDIEQLKNSKKIHYLRISIEDSLGSDYERRVVFRENNELIDPILDTVQSILEHKKFFLEKELEEL